MLSRASPNLWETRPSRFTGVQAWFGRSTLQWWALAGGELVSASSAPELVGLLDRALAFPTLRPRAAADMTTAAAMTAPAAHQRRPIEPSPRLSPGYTPRALRRHWPRRSRQPAHAFTEASARRHDPQINPSSGSGRLAAAAS